MSYDFHKKVVILTGGGRGLGVGIARAFSRCGATLVITGRTEAPLLKTRDHDRKGLPVWAALFPEYFTSYQNSLFDQLCSQRFAGLCRLIIRSQACNGSLSVYHSCTGCRHTVCPQTHPFAVAPIV